MEGTSAECRAAGGIDPEKYEHPDWAQAIEKGGYYHGLVTEVSAKRVVVKLGSQQAVMTPDDWKWTQNADGDSFLKNGDVVYVRLEAVGGGWDRCRLRCSRTRGCRLR